MAKIKARILAALGDAYNVSGGQIAPETIALASEIQIVHDVGRQVEFEALKLSAVGRGYFFITIPTTNGAGDTIRGAKNVYTELAAISPVPVARLDAWLIDAWLINVGSLTSAALAVHFPAEFPTAGTPPTAFPLAIFDTSLQVSDVGAAGDVSVATRNTWALRYDGHPLFLPFGSIFASRTITLAGTNQAVFLCWAGLTGTRPPGAA